MFFTFYWYFHPSNITHLAQPVPEEMISPDRMESEMRNATNNIVSV